jgi:hypothetical protein
MKSCLSQLVRAFPFSKGSLVWYTLVVKLFTVCQEQHRQSKKSFPLTSIEDLDICGQTL